jgi:hypothetical protein
VSRRGDGLAFGAVFGLGSASMAFDPSYTAPAGARIFFERRELERLLRLYGQMVAAGEWRDYAIDGLRETAVFSVFRRASEAPLYRIEKRPALARKQGAWAVIGQVGMILKRGHELDQVLRLFDKGRFKVVD